MNSSRLIPNQIFMQINSRYCTAIIFIVLYLLIALSSLLIAFVDEWYIPEIRSPIYGFSTAFLGLLSMIPLLTLTSIPYLQKYRKAFIVIMMLLGIASICIFAILQFMMGIPSCILWIASAIFLILPANSLTGEHELVANVNESYEDLTKTDDKEMKTKPCKICCYYSCVIVLVLVMAQILGVACWTLSLEKQHPIIGEHYSLYVPLYDRQVEIHAYCITPEATQNNYPTFFMEHGGGSNSIAFLELGYKFKEKYGWRVCSYDRLGYGRSDPNDKKLSQQERIYLTAQIVDKVQEGKSNKDIILGGWSAGVEIIQVYYHMFPENVKGLIFMDGYPQYLLLEAIYNNQSSSQTMRGQLPLLGVIVLFEPIGVGFIVGGSPIADETANQFYSAYYRTGYFWQSQYNDIANPYTNTDWLTQKGQNYTIPYPNQPIELNWPDIDVPLLILPAQNTVKNEMYKIQCEKYLEKCTNANKKMVVMEGGHDFLLASPQIVADTIYEFFSPLLIY